MELFEQLKWAVAHDPCRLSDRWPYGAVTVGTDVGVRVRIEHSLCYLVNSAKAHLLEGDTWRTVPLCADDLGYAATLPLGRSPHVAFYVFELLLSDESTLFYLPRMDARSSAGALVVPGRDGEWTEEGWSWDDSAWAARPGADTGLGGLMPGFQVTVYDAGFATPSWMDGAIMYQIFPDRFARGARGVRMAGLDYHAAMGRPVLLHESWDDAPRWTGEAAWKPRPGAMSRRKESKPDIEALMRAYDPVDFFGGTLDGIREKLDYLAGLGVEVIYLNPIFEARSNHRYDTADYERIDPLLGDEGSFARLAEEARKRGISLVLDAVLSHTGMDSKYFNGKGTYAEPGAAQGPGSAFRPWYEFFPEENGGGYRCWWGDPTLPEVDERSETWQRYIFGDGRGEGVLGKWLGCGARGYRLDVADEIPDDVLERLRSCVKGRDGQAAIIGEVWEDPTTKSSYGAARTYALGGALDSVMNYPLRSGLLSFALGTIDALQLVTLLKHQQANYPQPMYRCLMNLVSSHDIERVRSVLSLGGPLRHLRRDEQVAAVAGITGAQDVRGAALQKMVAGLLYALPGMPCLYYGDERGMHGGADPFCRATFPWDDHAVCDGRHGQEIRCDHEGRDGRERGRRGDCGADLTGYYREIGARRKNTPALRTGDAAFYAPHEDVVCVMRWCEGDEVPVIVAANRSEADARVAIDLRDSTPFDDVVAITAPARSTACHVPGK